MKSQIVTTGIVLSRTDFQEADRILTVLTPDHGKIRLIAKGVRKSKSKLAGGIELFSLSNITFLKGRGDMGTLVSSRLIRHFGDIVKDIRRTMLGYDLLKRINRTTEDAADIEYYEILGSTLEGLNDLELSCDLVELWFTMQLLKITGHTPNLMTDMSGNKLKVDKSYLFDFDDMAFREQAKGPFQPSHIKMLRLAYGTQDPGVLKQVRGAEEQAEEALKLAKNILKLHVRI